MDSKLRAYEWLLNLYKENEKKIPRRREAKNIISYAATANESFADKKFNPIDSLVLSQFAYLHFDGFVPGLVGTGEPVKIGDLAGKNNLDRLFHHVRDGNSNRKLFEALVASPRFKEIEMNYYVNKVNIDLEKQFSAITFLLNDGTAFLAYRGTDSTFVGWKEDFNMIFTSPVPSQKEGVNYLNSVGDLISCKLKIGGHSKGGNIAIYSAVKCNELIQNRITGVFSHDGPGFQDEIFAESEYLKLEGRIFKYLPQSSLVGMLLNQQEDYLVVKSNRTWVFQHDPFSWVIAEGDFQYIDAIKNSAIYFSETLKEWLDSLTDEKRELFVNTLFQVVYAADAETKYDLTEDWHKKAIAVLLAIKGIDNETRKFVLQTINALFVLGIKNLRDNDFD